MIVLRNPLFVLHAKSHVLSISWMQNSHAHTTLSTNHRSAFLELFRRKRAERLRREHIQVEPSLSASSVRPVELLLGFFRNFCGYWGDLRRYMIVINVKKHMIVINVHMLLLMQKSVIKMQTRWRIRLCRFVVARKDSLSHLTSMFGCTKPTCHHFDYCTSHSRWVGILGYEGKWD